MEPNINASIDLCRAYIARGHDVHLWKSYLDRLMKDKAKLEVNYSEGEPPGLSEGVYQRIWFFKQPTEYDEFTPISSKINTDAIIEAYRKGELEVQPGMVSIWVDGERVTPLIPDNWDSIGPIWDKYSGRVRWLENPGPARPLFAAVSIPASNPENQHNVWISLAHPNSNSYIPVQFMEDTGAVNTMILMSDLDTITQAGGSPHFSAFEDFQTAAGSIRRPVFYLKARLLGQDWQNAPNLEATHGLQVNHLTDTDKIIPVVVSPSEATGGFRLLGPFLREYFFTGSAPDGRGNLVIASNKTGMVQNIPAVNLP